MEKADRKRETSSGNVLRKLRGIPAFTLVELIVVITILAILATVGFLTLSGYTDDARSATVAANVRTVYSAILTESTTSGNSPRYYVNHDSAAWLSWAVAFAEGNAVPLTGGQWGTPNTNYSAGNPYWDRLRMSGEKFRLSAGFRGLGGLADEVAAAYDTGAVSVGAFDYVGKAGINGKTRTATYFQVVGISPSTKKASVTGNYSASGTWAPLGLVRDSGSASSTGAVTEGATVLPAATSQSAWWQVYNASMNLTFSANDKGDISCNGRYYVSTNRVGVTQLYSTFCPAWFTGPSPNSGIQTTVTSLSNAEKDIILWTSKWVVDGSCNDVAPTYTYAIKTNNTNEYAYGTTNPLTWAGDSSGNRYVQILCSK